MKWKENVSVKQDSNTTNLSVLTVHIVLLKDHSDIHNILPLSKYINLTTPVVKS